MGGTALHVGTAAPASKAGHPGTAGPGGRVLWSGPMFRRWALALVMASIGCGFNERGFQGTPQDEADAAPAIDGAVPADAPGLRDGAPASPDRPTEVGGCSASSCPAPANADPFCVSGQCGFICRRGFHKMGDGCAANDQVGCCGDGCLMCAPPANGTIACTNRQCVLTCNGGFHPSGTQCVANDSPACCGAGCAPCPAVSHGTAQCRNGACDFVCDAGFHKEGAACAMDDSAACCGPTCARCPAPANGAAACKSGQCSFTCDSNFHPAGNGCAINGDLACCGPGCQMCSPTRANANAVCMTGGCADPSPCLTTHHDCNGACVANDAVGTCGAACTPCAERPNATVSCNGTACVYACAMNFADCDGNPNNGCEANLLTDARNCGGCATAPKDPHICAGGGSQQQVCVNGQCGCPAGWGNCNGDGSDGCEVNLLTSNVHCGACNPRNPSETDLLTEEAYKAANADPACRVYKLETCELGHCKGP